MGCSLLSSRRRWERSSALRWRGVGEDGDGARHGAVAETNAFAGQVGVVPLQFPAGQSWASLGLDGTEVVSIADTRSR